MSHSHHSYSWLEIFYELTVLNYRGKIIYNAILLQGWTDIQAELAIIEKHCRLEGKFVQDRQTIMELVASKELEFRDYLISLTSL